MEFAGQQAEALSMIAAWLKTPRTKENQVFKLFGFAGTGKTTLARELQNMVGKLHYMTYTGKAALVLKSKGCFPATTIHSAIYEATRDEDSGEWYYSLTSERIHDVDLLVVDEGPMVGTELASDVLALGKRVLVLGDPYQLEPVRDEQFWGLGVPDFMLTEIHRQAADNPIIRMSMEIRARGRLTVGDYGESKVIKVRRGFDENMLLDHDQVICGKNSTRHDYNKVYRTLLGHAQVQDHPVAGERLICLRNNRMRGFLNGQMFGVLSSELTGDGDVNSVIKPWDLMDDEAAPPEPITTRMEYFRGMDSGLDWRIKASTDEFCYGYIITCHKSQGSQWPSVMVLDQSAIFKEAPGKWLYTAVTRAADRVTVLVT